MKTVRWIRAPVDKVEDKRRWSTRRVERAPGTPFSWAACDETKVAALPRSRDQGDGRGRRRPGRGYREINERGQFLFYCVCVLLATVPIPEIFYHRQERWLEVLNNRSTPKPASSGQTDRAVGHGEFQRERADIADVHTWKTGQYYHIINKRPERR